MTRYANDTTIEFVRSINNFKKYIYHYAELFENDPAACDNAQLVLDEMNAEMNLRLTTLNG